MQLRLLLLFIVVPAWCSGQAAQQLLDSAIALKQSNISRSLQFAQLAYQGAVQEGDSTRMVRALMLVGRGQYLTGRLEDAARSYLQAARQSEQVQDTVGIIEANNELTILYLRTKNFPAAEQASQQAVTLSQQLAKPDALGNSHNNRGLYFTDTHQADSAEKEFRTAYLFYKRGNSRIGMSYALDYLSSVLAEKGRLEEALSYLKQCRELREQEHDNMGIVLANNNIGELLLLQKKPGEALPYFIKARELANNIDFKNLSVYTFKMEGQALNQLGHYQQGYDALNTYTNLREDLLTEENNKAIHELQTKYETEKKERRNAALQQQNQLQAAEISRRNLALGGTIVVIALITGISYLLFNRARLRQQARLQEEALRQQALRTQAIIDAEENERQRLARELHDGVGQMLAAARRRMQVYSTHDTQPGSKEDLAGESLSLLDESIREVRQLSHSMMPPALRNKTLPQALDELAARIRSTTALQVHTDWVDADNLTLEKGHTLMLYRAVQEIISNTIKHAAATSIHIDLVNHDTELSLMVYDDGKGFEKTAAYEKAGGLGLKNIQSRIEFIGGTLELDTQPGSGATYIIELPLKTPTPA